jgi:hypothetical protein
MRYEGHVALMGEKGTACKVAFGKPEGKKLIGRHTCRWEENIKTYHKVIKREGVDWIHLLRIVIIGGLFCTQ